MRRSRSTLPLLGIALVALTACQKPTIETPETPSETPSESTTLTPLPQDPLIQSFMNQNLANQYTEPYRSIPRAGDDLEQVIVAAIDQAQETIDVAVQEFRLPNVAQALARRSAAGVRVRVVLENTYSRPFSQFSQKDVNQLPERERARYDEFVRLVDLNGDGTLSAPEIAQREALVILDRAKIPRIDDTEDGSAGSGLMHHKFVVIDGRWVIVSSANFTLSDVHGDLGKLASRGNANNLLKLDSPELAQHFTEEFAILWGDGPGGQRNSRFGVKKPARSLRPIRIGSSLVEVSFSPTSATRPWASSSNGMIRRTLQTATQSLDLALFVFSEQRLVDAMAPLSDKGVQIRALIHPEFAYRPYSELLDMLGITLPHNCKYDPQNRPWTQPIQTVGVPRLLPGDMLHHKFGLIDRKTVITGSHNWTEAANNLNDETVLAIHSVGEASPKGNRVAAHYHREFERLYSPAILGIPPAVQKKFQAKRAQCGDRSHR